MDFVSEQDNLIALQVTAESDSRAVARQTCSYDNMPFHEFACHWVPCSTKADVQLSLQAQIITKTGADNHKSNQYNSEAYRVPI